MRRKKRLAGLVLALLLGQALLLPMPISAQAGTAAPFRVVAYYPSWRSLSQVASVPFDQLTHLIYAFAIPTEDGGLQPLENAAAASALIREAHARGVKVLLAVGGYQAAGAGVCRRHLHRRQTDKAGGCNRGYVQYLWL